MKQWLGRKVPLLHAQALGDNPLVLSCEQLTWRLVGYGWII
ncbi:MAG: hypothetical protein P8J37_02270 [Fuerstiella sp.]|nr:hypothetical protein [Fuerstiella sp.]